jgi:putative transposase
MKLSFRWKLYAVSPEFIKALFIVAELRLLDLLVLDSVSAKVKFGNKFDPYVKSIRLGYRRIWALLCREGVRVNLKTVYRVMKAEGLLQSVKRYEAKRTRQTWDMTLTSSNQVWHIDMTKIWTDEGWAYLFSIIDAYDRRIVAWELNRFCRDDEAIRVLEKAVNHAFPNGVRGSGLKLVQDNGSQFTSRDFVQTLKTLEITPIRTSYRHPQSNGKMERWYRTLKEEEVWLNEYRSLEEAKASFDRYICFYNYDRVHSALGYVTPMEAYSGELSTQVA